MAFWRKRDEDLNDEIASHLRMAAADMGEEAAKREFGNVGLVKEVTRSMWGFASWESLLQDLRYALRVLAKSPGYTLIGILSLALGIGANTAIFSLIDSIMLKSLPVQEPNELISIGNPAAVGWVSGGGAGGVDIFSYPFYQRFRSTGIFSGVYANGPSTRLNVDESTEHPLGRFVTDNYFSVLGVAPFLGRGLTPGEQAVVVISYAYWQRHFRRAADVIGRHIRINGTNFTVIGVTPREFYGDIVGYQSDMWFSVEEKSLANPGHNYLHDPMTQWLLLMGRLKPGVSLAQAQTVSNTIGLAILKEQMPLASQDDLKALALRRISVLPAANGFSRIRHSFSKPLLMLLILVTLVLLICCTNIANLQLARATSRAREMGLRLAIGASRPRLLRQLMTESLVLAIAGGAAGLLVAIVMGHLLLGLIARDNRVPVDFQLSGATLLFTAGLSIVASLFFGLVPALYATKASVASNLKESTSGRSHNGAQRFEKSLVVFQIVLSFVLLFASGLFIRTLQNLETSDVGYRRDQLIVVELNPVESGYHDEALIQLGTRLLDKFRNAPGISGASISENGLFSGTESMNLLTIPGFTASSNDDKTSNSDHVGAEYFKTIGTPIVTGRDIERSDMGHSSVVAVVNESMQRFYFPNANPVGRRFSIDDGKTWITIVGVAKDAKQRDLRTPAARRFYTPFALRKDDPITKLRLEVRAHGSVQGTEEMLRREIRNFDPNLQIESISTAQGLIDEELLQERVIAKLSSSFSLVALLLAGIGLYGVMSYLTQRRNTELGIRMALGATRGSVIGMVLRETLLVTVIGLVLGAFIANALGRLAAENLYGVTSFDPITATLSSVCIVLAAFLAGWLPARRASRVDPMLALRSE